MPNTPPRKSLVKRGRSRAVNNEAMQLHQLELLLNVSKTVAAYETLDDILTILVEIISTEVDAERSTLFLNDPRTGELYSHIAQGNFRREIRFLNTTGLAGHVYTTGQGVIVHDAYADPRFNQTIDEQTGFVTKSVLCAPIKTVKGATEIDLTVLLHKVMGEATKMLDADRSTLFLNDDKTNTLFTVVGEGLGATQIRFANHLGIAGTVFTTREAVNIPHAYADLRFNPAFDKQTGYFTRSILCVPVINKAGRTIGVTQVLNKRGGPFTAEDEARLRAFTAQVAIALENAKLFNDVQNMKNYNDSILESMSSAVITLDEDGIIATCNSAGLRMLRVVEADILGRPVEKFFTGRNAWIVDRVRRVEETQTSDIAMGADSAAGRRRRSVGREKHHRHHPVL